MRPTREGQALARHAETLFAAERAAEDELLSLRNLDSGSLRIGASTTIATYMIAEYLGTAHIPESICISSARIRAISPIS